MYFIQVYVVYKFFTMSHVGEIQIIFQRLVK